MEGWKSGGVSLLKKWRVRGVEGWCEGLEGWRIGDGGAQGLKHGEVEWRAGGKEGSRGSGGIEGWRIGGWRGQLTEKVEGRQIWSTRRFAETH